MTNDKTPMQEMLEWVRTTLPMFLPTPRMIEAKIELLLVKEKEQMQLAKKESYNDGWLEAAQYIMKYDKKQEDGR